MRGRDLHHLLPRRLRDLRLIPAVETERLLLRGLRDEDLDAIAAMCADPEVMDWVGGTLDRAEAWRHMASLSGHWTLRGFGQWALEPRAGGGLAGYAGLWYPEGWPAIEVGWTLARPFWGRGLATEAGRAALAYAREELGLETIVSLIHPDNARSQRVAQRLGLRPTERRFDHRAHRLVVWEGATAG